MPFLVANGATPTTAALAKQPTGTALRTMLQVATSAGNPIWVKKWGIVFDGTAAATPIACELIDTAAVGASGLTAHPGPMSYDVVSDAPTSTVTLGAAATGYATGATTEGTVTTSRIGDIALVSPTSGYIYEFPLGEEFFVPASRFLRIRVTAGASVNCWCFIKYTQG